MESRRKENFSEASAVHKGAFRNFFNIGVEEVNPQGQSATVTAWYLWTPSWGAPWGGTLTTTKDRQAVVSHNLGPMWPAEVPFGS